MRHLLILSQGGWNGHDLDSGWWIVMMIAMVAFWGVIAVAIVRAARNWSARRPEAGAATDSDPLRILDRRLAEGEISVEEYTRRRELLERAPGQTE